MTFNGFGGMLNPTQLTNLCYIPLNYSAYLRKCYYCQTFYVLWTVSGIWTVGSILTCDNLMVTFRPELEAKLKVYNEYYATNSKQQIVVKIVSRLFF